MPWIIVADDDELHREYVAAVLQRAGYDVLTSSDGIGCLDRIKQVGEEQVKAVITDIFMPERDGIELTIAIRKSFPSVPVIGTTGALNGTAEHYGRSIKKLGAASVLYKPFAAADLLSAVESILDEPIDADGEIAVERR